MTEYLDRAEELEKLIKIQDEAAESMYNFFSEFASNFEGTTDPSETENEGSLSKIVATIALELGRPASDAKKATQILKQNWIDDLETFQEVTKSSKNTLGLPAALFHKLKHFKAENDEEKEGETKEKKDKEEKEEKDEKEDEKDDESIEQNRIIDLLKIQKEKKDTSHVYAKVFVNDVTDLNTTDGTVRIDFGVQLWWWDPKYVGHEEGSFLNSFSSFLLFFCFIFSDFFLFFLTCFFFT